MDRRPMGHGGPAGIGRAAPTTDVIVCVHDALDDVRRCLHSVLANTPRLTNLLLVDDGSDEPTERLLQSVAATHPRAQVIRHRQRQGYTKAANAGLRAARSEYVVLLNSDTVVPPGWLDQLIECGESDPGIGIVGPLSNAAGYQTVPELVYVGGQFKPNSLPSGLTPAAMARLVRLCSAREFPRVPLINGFCYAIKRRVIATIGTFDETHFPVGYGEEDDYSIRAAEAGFALAVADAGFVFHAKGKSFGHAATDRLSREGFAALRRKHGADRIETVYAAARASPQLATIRTRIRRALTAALS